MLMKRLKPVLLCGALVGFSACAAQQDAPTAPSASAATPAATQTSTVNALTGSWTSAASAAAATSATPAGPCSGTTYTVTPTGESSASVTYRAVCSNVTVNGSGSGTVVGTTMNWATDGSIQLVGQSSCAFRLSGTATPAGNSTASLTYAGTVCGFPVSGSETLAR